jgi:hypothetical protein
MPINNFSVGRDLNLTVVTPAGPMSFNLLTNFKSKMDDKKVTVKGIDGKTRHVRFVDGWSGSFSIERRDSTPDDYFSQIEQNYFAGVNEQACSITQIIKEKDGSLTQYRYFGVLLSFDDAGEWAGDNTVKQMISFICERRIKIA